MNAKRMLDIFKSIYFKHDKQLGRWTNHNYNQTILKIKYANEDNCGISGNKQIHKELHDNEYIYIMGYETTHN